MPYHCTKPWESSPPGFGPAQINPNIMQFISMDSLQKKRQNRYFNDSPKVDSTDMNGGTYKYIDVKHIVEQKIQIIIF